MYSLKTHAIMWQWELLYIVNELPFDLEKLQKRFEESDVSLKHTSNTKPLFESEEEYKSFLKRHSLSHVKYADISAYEGDVYLGIDAGSTTVKLVLIGKNN